MVINRKIKRKGHYFILFSVLVALLLAVQPGPLQGAEPSKDDTVEKCPDAGAAPPPILDPDMGALKTALSALKAANGRSLWTNSPENDAALAGIFLSTPRKTKLEQFFQLLYLIQKNLNVSRHPIIVTPPLITNVLLSAKVFTDPAFPKRITSVVLKRDDGNRPPLYKVQFSEDEVRFPINQGRGFSTWDQGMCQIAKELVFYPGFSFRIRTARNSKNLVVDDFDKVEIYGQFGTRKIFTIDLNYVELEKVEFIEGTDLGKVKARVARREFRENKHSKIFKFIGTMIPNTSKQRIDW